MRRTQRWLTAFLLAVLLLGAGRIVWLAGQSELSQTASRRLRERVQPAASAPQQMQTGRRIDFAALHRCNPQLAAWLEWPGAELDEPVAWSGDNSYYLTHRFDTRADRSGCPFIAGENAPDLSDWYTVIYGHNMADGSRFGGLDAYLQEDFFHQNPFFTLYLPNQTLQCDIFAVCRVREGSGAYASGFVPGEEYTAFLQSLYQSSLYDTGQKPDGSRRVVALSTCDNESRDGRILVCAVCTPQTE